jgi:hypothetical protein
VEFCGRFPKLGGNSHHWTTATMRLCWTQPFPDCVRKGSSIQIVDSDITKNSLPFKDNSPLLSRSNGTHGSSFARLLFFGSWFCSPRMDSKPKGVVIPSTFDTRFQGCGTHLRCSALSRQYQLPTMLRQGPRPHMYVRPPRVALGRCNYT